MSQEKELKKQVEELQQLLKRANTVAKVSSGMSTATNEQEILATVAEIAEDYQVTFSALNYLHVDENNQPEFTEAVAWRSGDGQPISLDNLPSTYFSYDDMPVLWTAYETPHEPTFIEHAFTDPRCETGNLRQIFKDNNVSAIIVIPLKLGNRWQGMLSFNWAEPQTFAEELRQLIIALQP